MRILFDSKKGIHKSPFGCLTPNRECRLCIHIPCTVKARAATICLTAENGDPLGNVTMTRSETRSPYEIWEGCFSLSETGLYFYYFRITGCTGTFRLFKQGDDTNMEAGDTWQLSCVPADFTTPDWAKGAIIYQIFPDRFRKTGACDLTGKLAPYTLHQSWFEEPVRQPTPEGKVLNNDFFGGNFRGITEKMDYIASLGTTILYLNPISKSFSNHRYDTGDYKMPDPLLGTLDDFRAMCSAAHARGIRVVLDGVYSHTGDNSLYFDKYGAFGGTGAYCDPQSPYRSWYHFSRYPDDYKSWWGIDTLPTVDKSDRSFIDYIITGADSVVSFWLSQGADGFRLDVADELPDSFIAALKNRIRQIKPDALLIGEVWEDASNKIAYDARRRYFVDGELDSVMNYPFRTAILDFLQGADDGRQLKDTVMAILENYPRQVALCNMNLLGSHDTPRIRTVLAEDSLLEMATVLQFTLPGSPSIYYGDEVGMEGGKDPFNRRTYPWGRENKALLAHYTALGWLRRRSPALQLGELEFFQADRGRLGFSRTFRCHTLRVYINRSGTPWEIPAGNLLLHRNINTHHPGQLCLEAMGWCITEEI